MENATIPVAENEAAGIAYGFIENDDGRDGKPTKKPKSAVRVAESEFASEPQMPESTTDWAADSASVISRSDLQPTKGVVPQRKGHVTPSSPSIDEAFVDLEIELLGDELLEDLVQPLL